MSNCLVTKLKGVVDNDNLKFYNTIFTKPNTNGNVWDLQVWASEIVELDVIGDGTFTNFDGTYDYGKHREGDHMFVRFTGTGKIKITNKYALTSIQFSSVVDEYVFDYSDFVFNNLTELILVHVNVDFDALNVPSLTTFKCGSIGIPSHNTGDLPAFLTRHSNLEAPEISTGSSVNVTGYFGSVPDAIMAKPIMLFFYGTSISDTDIATFGRLINVEQLSFVGLPQVAGTVESFVQMARSKGRTEFSNLNNKNWYFNDNITFNGNIVGSAAKNDFSWTANTITLGGVTVNA